MPKSLTRVLVPAVTAVAVAGVVAVGPATAAFADNPVPPPLDSILDVNGNGVLDSSETPDNPDDVNGNGVLDSSETPDNPDDVNGNGVLDSSETPDNPDLP